MYNLYSSTLGVLYTLVQLCTAFTLVHSSTSMYSLYSSTLGVLYTEFLKCTDTQTHIRAKFSRICAKFIFWKAKLSKQTPFHIFGTFFQVYYVFMTILLHNSAQNYIKQNFDRPK